MVFSSTLFLCFLLYSPPNLTALTFFFTYICLFSFNPRRHSTSRIYLYAYDIYTHSMSIIKITAIKTIVLSRTTFNLHSALSLLLLYCFNLISSFAAVRSLARELRTRFGDYCYSFYPANFEIFKNLRRRRSSGRSHDLPVLPILQVPQRSRSPVVP